MAPVLFVLYLLAAAAGQSSSPEGVWRAEYTTTEGRSHVFTLTLKVSEGTLSGTISSDRGKVAISSGTVKGQEIVFTVTRRANYDSIDVNFSGTVDGDLMRLAMRVGPREPIAVTARRQAPDSGTSTVGTP